MQQNKLFDRLNELMVQTDRFMSDAPWGDKDFYGNWLAQTNYYTNHTTRLLALAGALLPLNQQPLHNRFLKHAGEEKGHENLSILDLKHLDKKLVSFPELPSTQAFYQVQYYWIEHCDPRAFFGFILYLESIAARYGKKLGSQVESFHGKKCSHFLKVHADEDIEHVAEAIKYVESFPADVQESVLKNLEQCADIYHSMVRDCARKPAAIKSAA